MATTMTHEPARRRSFMLSDGIFVFDFVLLQVIQIIIILAAFISAWKYVKETCAPPNNYVTAATPFGISRANYRKHNRENIEYPNLHFVSGVSPKTIKRFRRSIEPQRTGNVLVAPVVTPKHLFHGKDQHNRHGRQRHWSPSFLGTSLLPSSLSPTLPRVVRLLLLLVAPSFHPPKKRGGVGKNQDKENKKRVEGEVKTGQEDKDEQEKQRGEVAEETELGAREQQKKKRRRAKKLGRAGRTKQQQK